LVKGIEMAKTTTTRAKGRGSSTSTTDRETIQRWVEERGGKPAVVKSTTRGDQPGILRIDFPGFSGEQSLEPISWDDWFERFENAELAFLYQDKTAAGKQSRFNKLVARDGAGRTSARTTAPSRQRRTRTARSRSATSAKRPSAGSKSSKPKRGASTGSRTGKGSKRKTTGRPQARSR
jgi:hypothetical protein